MTLVFAHFSDLHLGRSSLAREHALMRGLVDHAIAHGAQHLLFGGDLVDHGNLEDARALREHLLARGYLHASRASLVPGNHDVWPFGEGHLLRDLSRALPMELLARVQVRGPSTRRRERFVALFSETFDGARRMGRAAYPCVKEVEGVQLGLLDTSSRRGLWRAAEGHFDPAEGRWLERTWAAADGPRILLMHHTPATWEVSREYLLSLWPRPLRRWVGRHGEHLLDARLGFRDQPAVEQFLRDTSVDAVLCGHLHLLGDPRGGGYDTHVAGVAVHVMGRSGGVHQPEGREVLAYHRGTAGEQGVSIETVFVEARELGG